MPFDQKRINGPEVSFSYKLYNEEALQLNSIEKSTKITRIDRKGSKLLLFFSHSLESLSNLQIMKAESWLFSWESSPKPKGPATLRLATPR